MLTSQQLIHAALKPVSEPQVQSALTTFMKAAYGDNFEHLGFRTTLDPTPVNKGLIALTEALQAKGWSQADTTVMGIRIYKSLIALAELSFAASSEKLLEQESDLLKNPRVVAAIATTPMEYSEKSGTLVFDADSFKKAVVAGTVKYMSD